ncbi:MAG TPA: hypothetical protein VFP97_04140 [Chitinophagaceae bacterium]|nr:hypothetical protein [Chitinophagaceae bacterium]
MKNVLIPALFTLVGINTTVSGSAQNLKSLEANNGFKKYKLGSKFILGQGVKQKDPDGADKVTVDYTKDMIGDIPVKAIELYYLRDTLSKIIVRISPEYYEKLIDAVKNSFGQPTQDLSYNEKIKIDSAVTIGSFKDDYVWKANRIKLQYLYIYPKTSGGAYGNKTLYLAYSLNDYAQRLQRSKKGVTSAKNF